MNQFKNPLAMDLIMVLKVNHYLQASVRCSIAICCCIFWLFWLGNFFAVHAFCTVQHRANTWLIYGLRSTVLTNISFIPARCMQQSIFVCYYCHCHFLKYKADNMEACNSKWFFPVFKRLSKLLKLLTYQVCTSHCITANIQLYYFLPVIMSPWVLSVTVYPLW
jgi:hypothetical protein